MRKALLYLYLAVDDTVANDVIAKVNAALAERDATLVATEERLRQWEIDADEARGIDEENHHLRLRLKATEERAEKAEAKLRRVIGGQSR